MHDDIDLRGENARLRQESADRCAALSALRNRLSVIDGVMRRVDGSDRVKGRDGRDLAMLDVVNDLDSLRKQLTSAQRENRSLGDKLRKAESAKPAGLRRVQSHPFLRADRQDKGRSTRRRLSGAKHAAFEPDYASPPQGGHPPMPVTPQSVRRASIASARSVTSARDVTLNPPGDVAESFVDGAQRSRSPSLAPYVSPGPFAPLSRSAPASAAAHARPPSRERSAAGGPTSSAHMPTADASTAAVVQCLQAELRCKAASLAVLQGRHEALVATAAAERQLYAAASTACEGHQGQLREARRLLQASESGASVLRARLASTEGAAAELQRARATIRRLETSLAELAERSFTSESVGAGGVSIEGHPGTDASLIERLATVEASAAADRHRCSQLSDRLARRGGELEALSLSNVELRATCEKLRGELGEAHRARADAELSAADARLALSCARSDGHAEAERVASALAAAQREAVELRSRLSEAQADVSRAQREREASVAQLRACQADLTASRAVAAVLGEIQGQLNAAAAAAASAPSAPPAGAASGKAQRRQRQRAPSVTDSDSTGTGSGSAPSRGDGPTAASYTDSSHDDSVEGGGSDVDGFFPRGHGGTAAGNGGGPRDAALDLSLQALAAHNGAPPRLCAAAATSRVPSGGAGLQWGTGGERLVSKWLQPRAVNTFGVGGDRDDFGVADSTVVSPLSASSNGMGGPCTLPSALANARTTTTSRHQGAQEEAAAAAAAADCASTVISAITPGSESARHRGVGDGANRWGTCDESVSPPAFGGPERGYKPSGQRAVAFPHCTIRPRPSEGTGDGSGSTVCSIPTVSSGVGGNGNGNGSGGCLELTVHALQRLRPALLHSVAAGTGLVVLRVRLPWQQRHGRGASQPLTSQPFSLGAGLCTGASAPSAARSIPVPSARFTVHLDARERASLEAALAPGAEPEGADVAVELVAAEPEGAETEDADAATGSSSSSSDRGPSGRVLARGVLSLRDAEERQREGGRGLTRHELPLAGVRVHPDVAAGSLGSVEDIAIDAGAQFMTVADACLSLAIRCSLVVV